jgi:hypothetical protein
MKSTIASGVNFDANPICRWLNCGTFASTLNVLSSRHVPHVSSISNLSSRGRDCKNRLNAVRSLWLFSWNRCGIPASSRYRSSGKRPVMAGKMSPRRLTQPERFKWRMLDGSPVERKAWQASISTLLESCRHLCKLNVCRPLSRSKIGASKSADKEDSVRTETPANRSIRSPAAQSSSRISTKDRTSSRLTWRHPETSKDSSALEQVAKDCRTSQLTAWTPFRLIKRSRGAF